MSVPDQVLQQAHARIAELREAINAMDYVCSGTLLERYKVCGKPNCHCADDPGARHGPYFVWGRLSGGTVVQQTLLPEQAAVLRKALANYRKLKKILRRWETETKRIIDARIAP